MKAPLIEELQAKAVCAYSYKCNGHTDCYVTSYEVAVLFRSGDKAHRMEYTFHSSEPDKALRAGAPYCGSKKYGYSYSGQFVDAVTCGRC